MTLTLLHALQHCSLDMLFQCCFCGQNAFNWAALLCKQEPASFIHRNTCTSNIVQENNKWLNTLKICIAKVTVFIVEVKPNPVWRLAHVVGSCVLIKPGSDLRRKRKNKQHKHALFENASASIGPNARRSHLVYRNTELSDHPEHEALIISFSLSLSAACVVCQLALLNLCLCWRCSHCLTCACVAGLNQALLWHLRKCVKYSLLTEGIERSEM